MSCMAAHSLRKQKLVMLACLLARLLACLLACRVDLFKNSVFVLSCGRVKMELFENPDVASFYSISEDVLRDFVKAFSLSVLVFRISQRFAWTGIFPKPFLVWTQIFLYG